MLSIILVNIVYCFEVVFSTRILKFFRYPYYGDIMIKKCAPYILAIVLGIIFGYYMFDGEIHLSNILNKSDYVGFQIGVYTDLQNAEKIKEKFEGSVLIKDEELYRVYYAILHNDKNIEVMERHLQNNKINYYLKDLEINDMNLIAEISSLESLMADASSPLFLELNKKILISYEGYTNETKSIAYK